MTWQEGDHARVTEPGNLSYTGVLMFTPDITTAPADPDVGVVLHCDDDDELHYALLADLSVVE